MKRYFPVVQCGVGNTLIGLFGSFETRAQALEQLDEFGPVASLLFHVDPPKEGWDPVFEHEGDITDEEAKTNGWVIGSMGGMKTYLVDGPILETAQKKRKVRAKRKAAVKERTPDADMDDADLLDDLFGPITDDEIEQLELDA